MSTPAGVGILALLDLPDPCQLGKDDDVAMYGLAARILTDEDAPAEWGEPTPVACLNLRRFIGSRLDSRGRADLERQCNEVLGQDERVSSVSCALTFADKTIAAAISAIGAAGPFRFTVTVDAVSSSILRGA